MVFWWSLRLCPFLLIWNWTCVLVDATQDSPTYRPTAPTMSPTFLHNPKNAAIVNGEDVTLSCKAQDVSQIFFKCNDKWVEIDKQKHLETPEERKRDHVMHITIAITSDEVESYSGAFWCQCVAWAEGDKVLSSEKAYISKSYSPTYKPTSLTIFPTFLQNPKNVSIVNGGEDVMLSCKAQAVSQIFFKCNEEWVDIDKQKHLETSEELKRDHVMHIRIAITSDDVESYFGAFWCQCVAWAEGDKVLSSEKAYLSTSYLTPDSPTTATAPTMFPKFLQNPKNASIVNGEDVTLSCEAQAVSQIFFKCNEEWVDINDQKHLETSEELKRDHVMHITIAITSDEEESYSGAFWCQCVAWAEGDKVFSSEKAYISKSSPVYIDTPVERNIPSAESVLSGLSKFPGPYSRNGNN